MTRQLSGTTARGSRAPHAAAERAIAAPLLAALALAACGPDGRQVRLCQRIFAEIESEAARYIDAGADTLPDEAPGVALLFRSKDGGTPARFVCRFRGGRFAPGQSELVGVTRLSGQPVSHLALQHLRNRVGLE